VTIWRNIATVDPTVRSPELAAAIASVVAGCATITALHVFGRSLRGIVQGDSVPSVFIPQLVDLFKQGGS
jgi:Zn-dependent alcohol dehydrogenase